MKSGHMLKGLTATLFSLLFFAGGARSEVLLQFFNNSWEEIAEKIPELAEVGYTSLWLPPPQKCSGGASVGYDLWDPFDLGGKDQRSTVKTRYGTEEELLRLIETAHRFGMRVYFDNIMNHRAFDIPGYNADTPIDIYPGMLPEDFHLRVTEEGFYRKWNNTENWGNTWQVQYQNLSDLIDIAHETPNGNFGPTEGSTHPKISFIRHPNNPEYYDYGPTGYCGFGNSSITTNTIAQYPDSFKEDVGGYLMRSVRWLVDKTKVDGLRLDAVKHVPSYFFGEQYSGSKDSSSAGYCGMAQWQFNMSRGFIDWDNHRDTVFDTEKSYGRNDLMMFGEHMGEPPPYDEYWAAGMRLVDARTHQTFNDNFGNSWGSLSGLDSADYISGKQMGQYLGVYYAKSHDDNVAYNEQLHNAMNLTRGGLPVIYTDGNRHAETLGQSGGAFPRHANTAYLGQWSDSRIPNLVGIHNSFARAAHIAKWADADVVIYERRDKRENGGMSDADGTVLLVMVNDNYESGQSRSFTTTFGHTSTVDDEYLYNYSTYGGGFYTYASAIGSVIIPPGGYFAFAPRSPEESDLWKNAGGKPVSLYQNGQLVPSVSVIRRDGPDGDASFNPYGVTDSNTTDYAYTYSLPRVTVATNLKFVARVDGSAINVLMKLDGGINLNTNTHSSGDPRDHPPGNEGSTDVFLGYEQAGFDHRQHKEKFAAVNSVRNQIGSSGAETYFCTIGTAGYSTNLSSASNDWNGSETATWIYHMPQDTNYTSTLQFYPEPQNASGSNITVWVKLGYQDQINHVFLYYTADGSSWPEGAGGGGAGNTQVKEMTFGYDDGTVDWYTCTIGPFSNNTSLRYKIGACKYQTGIGSAPWDCVIPNTGANVARKMTMMGVWTTDLVNAQAVTYRPHNDFGLTATGLVEGFHVISARAFLDRSGKASIYNTFVQPFYFDASTPTGEVKYPSNGDTLYQSEYGVVVRTDPTVKEVWYNIGDADFANDDAATSNAYGNGTNLLGRTAWAKAYSVTPTLGITSAYPKEWRFSYFNIPTGGTATIRVKLLEVSSSTNLDGADATEHFTTLERSVTCRSPATIFAYDWPTADGTMVASGWTVRVKFSSSLVDNCDDAAMREHFLITINGSAQSRAAYAITRDAGGGVGQIEFNMPDVYNGDTNFQHLIVFSLETSSGGNCGGGVTRQASRYVKAQPSAASILVQIIDPPEVDSDGQPYEIVLPDVAGPSSTQRQYSILVETDLSAKNLWLSFTNSVGYTLQIPSSSNLLTGTVAVVQGSSAVTGSGTLFDSQLGAGNLIKIDTNFMIVSQVVASNSLLLTAAYPGATASGLTAYRILPNPAPSGSKQYWSFLWTNMTEGYFTFVANVDTNGNTNTVEASATRNATVVFREYVTASTNDADDDEDGLLDLNESSPTNLPGTNPETWGNGAVHIWNIYGKTDPLRPDTDGDGLPDGLESGQRTPIDAGQTDTNMDTNGDGWRNFIGDIDPPFYNTTDNSDVPNYVFYDSRTKLIAGSTTDPNNPDSDYDGIPDGIEDANRNGWVDGDGSALYPSQGKGDRSSWPTKTFSSSWTETDPNDSDTDNDLASDGYGEDTNFNNRVEGDANSNRVYDAGEAWTESNPLNPDTDGDGLPDGWEAQYALDPLDNGTNSLRTAAAGDGNPTNGASGNPDGDEIVEGGVTNPYINALEYQNGTNPRQFDTGAPPPEGSITVGAGNALGELTGLGTTYQEFTDWTADDCLVIDEYEGDGGNNQLGDVYMAYDGYDSSRDIVAFYAHDGGDVGSGGDGRFYFRVDFQDLAANAEEGNLDLYVVVDTGNPANGPDDLPDEVDLKTSNRWEAVVAVYQSGVGQVYSDASTTVPGAFLGAYFNATLDSCEFSISRSALSGWLGNMSNLHFQVFTTKDGTCNSCNGGQPGAGDIGGRNDVRDTIYDDRVAEDYWMDQASVPNVLGYWWSGAARAGHAKVALVIHGNQAVQPGSVIQELINDGAGAGYNRPLGVHELYGKPLNLHVTPTLAAAMEWAKTDPATPESWRTNYYASGPAFNDWIAALYRTNVVALLGSTFSDHILPYFTKEFNRDNAALANEVLGQIYGFVQETNTVFWTPERVLDDDVLEKILDMGYEYTLVDQMTHMWHWLGRTTALGDGGYRINRFNGVKCFVMNDGASDFRFSNTDGGLPAALRSLLNRKARSGTQDQVVTMLSNWEDFSSLASANAYDRNVIWLANHPWIEIVALEDVAAGRIDKTWDGAGDAWYVEDRWTADRTKVANDWLHHATETNYDNWYTGSAFEEGLITNRFEIRSGVQVPKAYGMMYFDGVITDTWAQVNAIADTNLARLARGILHSSIFESAFHFQTNMTSTERYSTGEYIYPDTAFERLIDFARYAQSQTRLAAIVERVDDWAAVAGAITNVQTAAEDVDQDGEDEYLLFNDRLFGLFERMGGRLIGVWVRDILSDRVFEAAGNFWSYSGSATEDEGTYNVETNSGEAVVVAHRTSCLKDWWNPVNNGQYVNDVYAALNWTNGWRLTSSDGAVRKTVTLAPRSGAFEVQYQMSGAMSGQPLYVRHGFSPNLYDLLLCGQGTLGNETHGGGVMALANTNYETTVLATIGYADAGHNAGFNTGARDDSSGSETYFHTINMRNQAQTHQVEMVGTNSFAFSLGFQAVPSDWNADGMPNTYDDEYGLSTNAQGGAQQDADSDGMSNWKEYISGTSPLDDTDYLHLTTGSWSDGGIVVRFPTKVRRNYFVHYDNLPLTSQSWMPATVNAIAGTGGICEWVDDGSVTDPDPALVTNRFYTIEAQLPQ